ncbi:WhiB family transcriptional regulator [Streptomyces sp. NBC_01353]|uniref:WhiB family transcriptional regulator n=1 Tax=Streptomyces sp. NBC_01353 TaxID=2903835 RepID=UPI002E34CF58|nr:WhiB family transcriptional regulator [Streptomyces sp. NBC_01353]
MPLPDSPSWQAAAACAGLSPAVVFARRAQQAAPALRACEVCPVRRECERTVAPAESYFDGVCAGRLWRNGRAVPAARLRTGPAPRTRTAGADAARTPASGTGSVR